MLWTLPACHGSRMLPLALAWLHFTQGVVLTVSGVKPSWLERWASLVDYPPVAFIRMERDEAMVKVVQENFAVLEQASPNSLQAVN